MLILRTRYFRAFRPPGQTWPLLLFCLLAALQLPACSSAAIQDGDEYTNGSGGSTDTLEETVIQFDTTDTVTLAPGAITTLTTWVHPPRNQLVTFEILAGASDFDGFLLQATSRVNELGVATTQLQAPSQQSTFYVRASLDKEQEVRLTVSVLARAYGTLNVTPSYGGNREIDQWTASIWKDASCDDLEDYFGNGDLVARGPGTMILSAVPSGTPLAVTIRGHELAAGCVSLSSIGADEEREIVVEINDRPLDIGEGTLQLSFDVESTTPEFAQHLEGAIQMGLAAFQAGLYGDAAILLERMAAQLPDDKSSEFRRMGTELQLESVLTDLWSYEDPISGRMDALLTASTERVRSEDALVGSLELAGASSNFVLSEAAGAPAALSGFSEGSPWALSVDSGDTVVLGGSFTYNPLKWLVAVADGGAPTQALADAAQCGDVASLVVELSVTGPFDGCLEDCIQSLCEQALEESWQELKASENGESTVLQIGATATCVVEGSGQIQSLQGSWVGRLGDGETPISGTIRGE